MRFLKYGFLCGLFLSLSTLPAAAQDNVPWFDNYKAALAEAKRTQKPIFLEYRCEP